MRLIDADALFPYGAVPYESDGFATADKLYGIIKNAPTIDAVPVVRKPVAGYEGYYEVDQFGRVFGLDRSIVVVDGNRTYTKNLTGKQMKQSMHDKGYKTVSLTKDGKTTMLFVHRIVAQAFLPNPDNLPMINHKDEDKTNNFLENLEWCTAKYNANYGTGIERHARKIRGRESEKKIAVIQRSIDGYFMNWHSSVTEAAASVNGAAGAISAVCKGKRKKAYGYLWEYDGERKGYISEDIQRQKYISEDIEKDGEG